MKVEVQLINERGRALAAALRKTMPKYRGTLSIAEERNLALGRAVVTANLVGSLDGAPSPVLPALHEASMLFLRGEQIRVRGFELVDGVQYGQTWLITVS